MIQFESFYLISVIGAIAAASIFSKKKAKKQKRGKGKTPSHEWRQKSAKRVYHLIKEIKEEGKIFSYLRKIDPFVFEELLLIAFSKKEGFEAIRNKKYTGDGGIDGKVLYNNKLYLIQAKRYKGNINNQHIKEFANVIKENNAAGGYFIHTGKTSKYSFDVASGFGNIKIISGGDLIKLVNS